MWPHDLKLQRARQHLKELKAEIDRWVERDGYTIRVEPDPQPFESDYEVKAYIREWVGEDPFSLLMGDFLQNARAALDYIAYALAEEGADGPMPDGIAMSAGFPIVPDIDSEGYSGRGPDNFAEAASRQLATVAEPARAVIERLQPHYVGGVVWMHEPLWILHALARVDRHRFLHPTVLQTGDVRLDPATTRNVRMKDLETNYGEVMEDPVWEDPPWDDNYTPSAVLARFTAGPADPRKEMHMHFLADLEPGFNSDALPESLRNPLTDTAIYSTLARIEMNVRHTLQALARFLPTDPPSW